MNTHPTPEAQHASPDLQRQIYLQLVHELLGMLPPPVDPGPDKRASLDRRIKTATALVAAMLPATAEEADLACRAVAAGAGAHASDCLRQAVQQAADPKMAMKLRAQAASMGREQRGYRSLLLRLQAAREKREANDKAHEAAAWTEHCVAGLMTPEGDNVPPDPAAEATARDAQLRADADLYAINHPRRAQLIRRLGGLPKKCDFGPPEPELVRAIVHGDSLNLRVADQWPADAA